ncbi:MAG TPA: galactose oxidase [Bacteroidales bacterium]
MKKSGLFLFSLVLTTLIFFSCSKSTDNTTYIGNWSLRNGSIGGRTGAVCFVIGDSAYIGLGYNQSVSPRYFTSFYRYTAYNNQMKQVKDFKGIGRTNAVAFSVNNKGYVGLGFNDTQDNYYLKDFYEYDPATNSWRDVSTFDTVGRRGAVAFAIGNNGYVGTGLDGQGRYLSDFWKFTPDAGQGKWDPIPGIPFSRANATTFVLNGMGYVVTGDNNSSYSSSAGADRFYRYNPSSNAWEELRRIANVSTESYDDNYNIVRSYASGFASATKGYVTCGSTNGGARSDTWEYDPSNDIWTQKTSFEGSARSQAVGFIVSSKLMVGTGSSGSSYYDDIWEFKPDTTYDPLN